MILSDLQAAIKNEARIKVGTQWDTLIVQIMQELLRDYGLKARYREVLQLDTPVVMIASQATYALPANLQHVKEVRYSQDGTRFWPIIEFNEGQTRVSTTGFPRFFMLSAGGILLFPSSLVLTTDTCFISYWADPSALFVNPGDAFPIPRLEAAVKKATIARIIRINQQFEEADRMTQDAGTSFVNSQGGD